MILFFIGQKTYSQNNSIQINTNCQRYIGGISELDRTKFFSFHDIGNDKEQAAFRTKYNVTGGRGFWGPFSFSNSKGNAVGVYPNPKTGNTSVRKVSRYISTEHPKSAFKDGIDYTKSGDWAVEYYKNYADDSGRPEYFEPMNEPFVHAKDFYSGGWNLSEEARIRVEMAKFYNEIGKRIKATPELAKMKMVGYSAAYPSMEINDFGHWKDNMKMFMDQAGDNMDCFSTHLYDGINVTGQDSKRSGSNSEAILDLIEAYSFIKWGLVKPHAISEYGAIEKGYGDNYSDIASIQTVRSINHILFNLLEREDRMEISIPFITGKATWHITAANNYQPYQATLWKPTNIGQPVVAGWEYTPRIFFFELWKDVKGKRILVKSNNPDIQTHAFVDGNKLYLAVSNLDEANQTVDLNMIANKLNLTSVLIKDLKIYDQTNPEYKETTVTQAPSNLTLIKDETVVLEYTFATPVVFNNALREKKYFAANYLKPIVANSAITFDFNNVSTGTGFAQLRMSIGRKHTMSKNPIVKINGTAVTVPTNWGGYDQANRTDFFGMIEIPFPATLLKQNNTVSLEFPDSGGTVSSLILSVENYDSPTSTLGIQTFGASCIGSKNGEILITPYKSNTYKVAVTGKDLNETYEFTSNYKIKNLASGSYNLVITTPSDTSFKEEYKIAIEEPKSITVTSKVDTDLNKIHLSLGGSQKYTINHNGLTFTTSKSAVDLGLENGLNAIEVKGEKDCQGVFSENIIIDNKTILHPNPFTEKTTVETDSNDLVLVTLYAFDGKKIFSKTYLPENNKIELNLGSIENGIYFLGLNSKTINQKIKLIKQ